MRLPDSFNSLLQTSSRRWLVTGVAGFIGSNLIEVLLANGQSVRGLDNLSTGNRENLNHVQSRLSAEDWSRFEFVEADIRELEDCRRAVAGVDFVLHQAALGSVALSLEQPLLSHAVNVDGTLHMLAAARDAGVKRFVYASSCAVYGNETSLPLSESKVGDQLSPYATTKYVDEHYARVFARCFGLESVGLRYFNVFGPRQDPHGAYAAVIPQWISSMIQGETIHINGDGETSRDFCYVGDVAQANILAALADLSGCDERVFNVGLGRRTSLNQLHRMLADLLGTKISGFREKEPEYREFRPGDVRHSQADITLATKRLGYAPSYTMEQGLAEALDWYRA